MFEEMYLRETELYSGDVTSWFMSLDLWNKSHNLQTDVRRETSLQVSPQKQPLGQRGNTYFLVLFELFNESHMMFIYLKGHFAVCLSLF